MKLHQIVPLIPALSLDTPNGALFSPDRSHRYLLWRSWLDTLEQGTLESWLMVMGLNPSTADEKRNDPTVSQMVGRGKRLGFTGLLMTNRHAHVSTDPRFLNTEDGDRETLNDNYILAAAKLASMIIFASGNQASDANYITAKILSLEKNIWVFGLTSNGKPRHPRGLSLSVQPKLWKQAGIVVLP